MARRQLAGHPLSFLSLAGLVILACSPSAAWSSFPEKPIKVVVYTEPGGPIDLTARKFVDVAGRYTSAAFVVENIYGSGGLIAIEHVLEMQADGYTLLACTKTNIAKTAATGYHEYLNSLDWLGLLLIDPECVITRRDSRLANWRDLIQDAKANPGSQVWVGPGAGTMDHIMAVRIWDANGVSARWVPFGGGSKALAALMGGQAVAYVGNPGDAIGNPDLQVSIISRDQRLTQLPETPTFSEVGHPELSRQFMWRGFALRAGCPDEVRQWYDQLFRQVTEDQEWRDFWERDGIEVVYRAGPEFSRIVRGDEKEFARYLGRLNLEVRGGGSCVRILSQSWTLVALGATIAVTAVCLSARKRTAAIGSSLIPLAIVAICLLLFAQTMRFPSEWQGVGAASVPRLWIGLTAICALIVLVAPDKKTQTSKVRSLDPESTKARHTDRVWKFAAIIFLQWMVVEFVGYYSAAVVGAAGMLIVLEERRWRVVLPVGIGWMGCAYLVFARLLHVDLPLGVWFD